MFVRTYVEIPAPFAEVEQEFLRAPARWLPGLAGDAETWAAELLAKVGFGGDKPRIAREVRLQVGRPLRAPGKAFLPLRWEATQAQGLFPVMDADLQIAALGPDLTQLAIDGRYEPPFGLAGRIVDRVLMHRLAEATVRDLVQRIASRLTDIVAAELDARLSAGRP